MASVAIGRGMKTGTPRLCSVLRSPWMMNGRLRIGFSGPLSVLLESRVSVVSFETGGTLKWTNHSTFLSCLRPIVLRSSVMGLGRLCPYMCDSLESVPFKGDPRSNSLSQEAFSGKGWRLIVIPSSTVLRGRRSFF
jgi:hypothetical protein